MKKRKKYQFFKAFHNKKSMSIGFSWVFALVTIFSLGLLYIVFNQVFVAHLVPVIKSQVNSTSSGISLETQTQINNEIDKYMMFFHAMPFILFLVVVFYMFIVAITKERTEEQF